MPGLHWEVHNSWELEPFEMSELTWEVTEMWCWYRESFRGKTWSCGSTLGQGGSIQPRMDTLTDAGFRQHVLTAGPLGAACRQQTCPDHPIAAPRQGSSLVLQPSLCASKSTLWVNKTISKAWSE